MRFIRKKIAEKGILRYEAGMAEDGFLIAKARDDLCFYEDRARQERAAAESASKPEAASAHRLLAIEYEAQARELRAELVMGCAP
ncbi:hypothetical protein [Sphingobium sp. R-7]|uniref:hypothetical protein n=1 Tax=Sphingobium sp. R-7 TaxID=3375449 RepID=UPI00398A8E6E